MLTLSIHLGYLAWNVEERTARIPNEEVKAEFRKIIKGRNVNRKWTELIACSQKLLEDTIAGNGAAVAKAFTETNASAIEEINDYGLFHAGCRVAIYTIPCCSFIMVL